MMKTVLLMLLFILILCPAHAEEVGTLSYGDSGEAVTALQARLKDLGYYAFRVTGNFQENTREAVKQFQADNALPETGVADPALQSLILGPHAKSRFERMDAEYPGKLSHGDTGEGVRLIQARLAQLGYYEDTVSGNYLKNTREAVRAFQRLNGLSVDGIVGNDTWGALFDGESPVEAGATPRPIPAPTPVPYRLSVDVTNQVTSAYGLDEAGAYTIPVRHMLCSTGTDKDPTPLGTYILNGSISRWCYFPKWGTHGQYWTRIDASNAFHSVIYATADPMALKLSSYTGLGKPASHGCIRLMIEDAKWIYENCGKGTEVIIHAGAPDEELNRSLKIPPLDESVMLPVPTPQPTPLPTYDPQSPPPLTDAALAYGDENESVYWLQCRLAELGFYAGSLTGGFYQGTEDAVKAYQAASGLAVSGKADAPLLTRLFREAQSAVPTESPPAFRIVVPEATATPVPVPDFYVPRGERLPTE